MEKYRVEDNRNIPPGPLALMRSIFHRFETIFFDFFLIFTTFIYITGGTFFIQPPLTELVKEKPWVHRLAISVLLAAVLIWFWLRLRCKLKPSWILNRLSQIDFSNRIWLWSLFLIFTVTGTLSAWTRHRAFQTSFDMAIFIQAIWNTLHGSFLYSSIKGGVCLLSDHFSPILLLYTIPYRVWPDPKCLLLFQTLLAAAAVFPLFCLANEYLQSKKWALSFVAAYILYLPVRNAVRFDFHPEMIALPLIFWSFYGILKKRLVFSSLTLALILLTKENAALTVFGIASYAAIFKKHWVFGIFWGIFSAVYFFLVIYFIFPHVFDTDYFYLQGNYQVWGQAGIKEFLKHLFSSSSLFYLVKIYAPLGFLSFLSAPTFLMNLPVLAQNLMATNPMFRSIFFHYTIYLTPFVFISALDGAKLISNWKGGPAYFLISTLLFSGISEIYIISEQSRFLSKRNDATGEYLSKIPSDQSVRTHEFFAPHVAHRKKLYIYENQNPKEGLSKEALNADWIILDESLLGGGAEIHLQKIESQGYHRQPSLAGLFVYQKSK